MKRYNIEVTLECRNKDDAKNVADFIMFSGFIPITNETIVTVIAKNVDRVALEYLTIAIEEDERIISSSFHRTPF